MEATGATPPGPTLICPRTGQPCAASGEAESSEWAVRVATFYHAAFDLLLSPTHDPEPFASGVIFVRAPRDVWFTAMQTAVAVEEFQRSVRRHTELRRRLEAGPLEAQAAAAEVAEAAFARTRTGST